MHDRVTIKVIQLYLRFHYYVYCDGYGILLLVK